jgi:hypothetical protein
MAAAELSYAYKPLTDNYRVELTKGGYSAASWVNTVEEVEGQRASLEAAIDRMAAYQGEPLAPSSAD